jgi:hypothetical protein
VEELDGDVTDSDVTVTNAAVGSGATRDTRLQYSGLGMRMRLANS